MSSYYGSEVIDAMLPGKALSFRLYESYLQTDTGVREYQGAGENSVKELGKMVP